MSATNFLGQAMGFFLFIIGLSTLVNGKLCTKIAKTVSDNDALYFIMGILFLGLGVSLVIVHNIWVASWTVVISVLCWIVFIKGILNVLFPQVARAISQPFIDSQAVMYIVGLINLVVGAFLFYMGFFH